MKKILGVVVTLLSFSFAQFGAADSREEIAARLKPVGSVCVEGQDCASETASTQVAAAGAFDAKGTYDKTCSTCHAIGVAGAPKFGNADEWAPRIDKGMDTLYTHAVDGLPPGMPAKGMCFTCSEDELKQVVDFMVNAAK